MPPDLVLLVFIAVVSFFALLISYPWPVLTIGTVLYLLSLPFGWLSNRNYRRRDAEAQGAKSTKAPGRPADLGVEPSDRPPGSVVPFEASGERPPRR